MISKQFFKSSLIYTLIGALPYTTGVILIPFFASQLTPAQFGVNALYLTFMYFIQVIATFGMDTYLGINYFEHKDDKQRLKEFVGTVLIILTVIGTIAGTLILIGGNSIFHLIFRGDEAMQFFPFGLITVFSAIFNGYFKSYSSLLINQQRPIRFFWLNISNFILTIGASLAILYSFPYTLYGPIVGRLIPAVFSCAISVLLILGEFGFHYNKKFIRGLISFCGPLVIYAIMIWIVNYIDRYIIKYFLVDPTFVGIFDFIVKITLGIDLIQVGLVNTFHPKVYTIWKDQNIKESTQEVNRYYNGLTAITLLIIPLVVIAVPLLVPIIITKTIYYQSFAFLSILCLGFATRPWFYLFLAPLFYFKQTKVLPKVFFFSAVFQIIVSSFLIYRYGLMGAVWANFLVKPVQALFLWMESRKVFKFRVNGWKIFYLPIIFIGIVLFSELFTNDQNRLSFAAGQFLLSLGLVWFTYRKELILLIPKRRAPVNPG
jgi:O-antigen/teichoic acid export membrane protein